MVSLDCVRSYLKKPKSQKQETILKTHALVYFFFLKQSGLITLPESIPLETCFNKYVKISIRDSFFLKKISVLNLFFDRFLYKEVRSDYCDPHPL